MGRSQGFTLVEMAVAISIAGLLALLAIPRLRDANDRSNVHSARNAIATMFQQAKLRAIYDGRTTTLNVDEGSGKVWITAKPRRSSGAGTIDTIETVRNLLQIYGVTVKTTGTSFAFDPRGLGTLTAGNSMQVNVSRSTFKDSVMINRFGELSK